MTGRPRRKARQGLGLRERWLPYVFAIGAQDCDVGELLHAMYLETSEIGYVKSHKREFYADMLGCTPNAVSQRIGRAIHKWHALNKRGGGYEGRPAEYEVVIPGPEVVTIRTTTPPDQDRSHDNLSDGICPTCGGERLSQLGPPITYVRTPTDVTNPNTTPNGTVVLGAYGCER